MPISAKEFRSLLKEEFAPNLRALGFKGTNGIYRRMASAPFVHIVHLFVDKYGDSAWVELAVHIDGFPTSAQVQLPPAKVDAAACLIRRRLEHRRLLRWRDIQVSVGQDPDEARRSIAQLMAALSKDLPRFFGPFDVFPGPLMTLTAQDVLGKTKATYFLGDGRHTEAPVLLLLAELHLQQDDPEGATELAEQGQQLCQGKAGEHLRRLFSRVISGDRRFGFTTQDQEEFKAEQQAFLEELDRL